MYGETKYKQDNGCASIGVINNSLATQYHSLAEGGLSLEERLVRSPDGIPLVVGACPFVAGTGPTLLAPSGSCLFSTEASVVPTHHKAKVRDT